MSRMLVQGVFVTLCGEYWFCRIALPAGADATDGIISEIAACCRLHGHTFARLVKTQTMMVEA